MMTAEDRVKTVADFGFTERQARFLVLVMRHAGICVPRQYAAFAGTAYGRRVNALFDQPRRAPVRHHLRLRAQPGAPLSCASPRALSRHW